MNADPADAGMQEQAPPEGPASAGPAKKKRRHPIHLVPSERFNRAVIIFVTVCTAGRRKILANETAHKAILTSWKKANLWLVGRYVIMPDRLHFFCAPGELEAPSLEQWMRYWKSVATRNLSERGGGLWQDDHWDHDEKWKYTRSNPVRHGLISNASAWPDQGELNELRW